MRSFKIVSPELKDGLKAKLFFVRNKHKKDWLALLTTDLTIADEDVVRIYGKRWAIEVFFRTAKQHLELEKGCQSRDFDALIAHTTIVMTRYIFLSIEKRRTEDPRTLGLLFHRCCEEAEDCTLVKELCQILGITLENMKKLGEAQNQAERIDSGRIFLGMAKSKSMDFRCPICRARAVPPQR